MRTLTMPLLFFCLPCLHAHEPAPRTGPIHYNIGGHVGDLQHSGLVDSRGLAPAGRPDCLWTVNGGGHPPLLFALDKQGRHRGAFRAPLPGPHDWQALDRWTWHPERGPARHYLVILDQAPGADPRLLFVPEPTPAAETVALEAPVQALEQPVIVPFRLTTETGPFKAMAISHDGQRAWLISEGRQGRSQAWVVPFLPGRIVAGDAMSVRNAQAVTTLRQSRVTGLDMTDDGRRALVLTPEDAWEYTRGEKQTWGDAFHGAARRIRLPPRGRGEAICYDRQGVRFFLTSAEHPAPLFEMPVMKKVSP